MDRPHLSIIDETPQEPTMSLKWKWTIGSVVGVFLIFITFAWFLIQAFSSQMLKTESENVRDSLVAVSQRLNRLDDTEFDAAHVGKALRPTAQDFLDDQFMKEVTRPEYTVRVYDNDQREIYPKTGKQGDFKPVKRIKTNVELVDQQRWLIGRKPLVNDEGERLGTLVIEDHLTSYHKTFTRVYLIILISLILGLLLLSVWMYWLAGYFLQPINEMKRVADNLKKDPSSPERVSVDTSQPDELTALAEMLNEMLDRMQRFILQQQQFVEDVSHELRTPVAIVKGHMDLLNRWGKDDPKILDESIQASLQEMRRMQELVQEMLDLTRADQVELTFKDGQTDVKEMVNAVYHNYQLIYPDFTFVLDDDLRGPTWVKMSRDHLEQVLIILSDNAVKYSQQRLEIHFAASRTGQFVEIAIQDFGEGISAEDAKHVFDRFFRVDKARSRKQGGNGLGLSIAEKLITGYGGQIVVESSLGYGSVFRIKLPIINE